MKALALAGVLALPFTLAFINWALGGGIHPH